MGEVKVNKKSSASISNEEERPEIAELFQATSACTVQVMTCLAV